MITHRCNGSLEKQVSIRYQYPLSFYRAEPKGWMLSYWEHDYDYDVYLERIAAEYIKYCPYCGEELKEGKT